MGGELGFGLGSLALSLCILDGCLSIDLGDFTVLLSDTLDLSYITLALDFGDIDTGLVNITLVGRAGQRIEVVGIGCIAELLDVGIVDLETELV
jgi:hypothetical protein